MADYIGITEPQSDPLSPLTSELVKQLRDNPIAIAQGATGAPRVRPAALNLLIDEVDPANTASVVFTDLEPSEIILEFENLRNFSTIGRALRLAISTDNGATFTNSGPGGNGFIGTFQNWRDFGMNGYAIIKPSLMCESWVSSLDGTQKGRTDFVLFGSYPFGTINAIRLRWETAAASTQGFRDTAGQKIRLYQTGLRPGGGKA